jgi:hypothetical protein
MRRYAHMVAELVRVPGPNGVLPKLLWKMDRLFESAWGGASVLESAVHGAGRDRSPRCPPLPRRRAERVLPSNIAACG